MTLWFGSGSRSGSADPCFWLMDPDSDPDADPDPVIVIFIVTDLQDANKKLILLKNFLLVFLWRYQYIYIIYISKDKKSKRSHGYFMWETYFRRYKVIWKGWKSFFIIFVHFFASGSRSESTFPIQIRIRIQESQINADPMRIRNTVLKLL
jgi:hypothetical protein